MMVQGWKTREERRSKVCFVLLWDRSGECNDLAVACQTLLFGSVHRPQAVGWVHTWDVKAFWSRQRFRKQCLILMGAFLETPLWLMELLSDFILKSPPFLLSLKLNVQPALAHCLISCKVINRQFITADKAELPQSAVALSCFFFF